MPINKRLIPGLKRQEEYEWLKEVNSQSLQEAAPHLILILPMKDFLKRSMDPDIPNLRKKGKEKHFLFPKIFELIPGTLIF
jgi:hypothetical protein